MATFDEHINQAKNNLLFLSETNQQIKSYWDWQITISYYIMVHIVNAHLANKADLHYRTHEDVKNVLNPFNKLSLCKIPEEIYLCYGKLEGLSRRSRYLCNEKKNNKSETVHLTYEKHFATAIRHLDSILDYFVDVYKIGTISKTKISCQDLSINDNLKFFNLI